MNLNKEIKLTDEQLQEVTGGSPYGIGDVLPEAHWERPDVPRRPLEALIPIPSNIGFTPPTHDPNYDIHIYENVLGRPEDFIGKVGE